MMQRLLVFALGALSLSAACSGPVSPTSNAAPGAASNSRSTASGPLPSAGGPGGIPALPPTFGPPPPTTDDGGTYLSFRSDAGDWIGKGQTRFDTRANAAFTAFLDASMRVITIRVEPADSTDWTIKLSAPLGEVLTTGSYENAVRFQQGSSPGIDIFGNGAGCNVTAGRFVVRHAVFGPGQTIDRFVAGFEQHCEGMTPALVGAISLTTPFGLNPQPPAPPPAPPTSAPPSSTFSYQSDPGDYIGQGLTGQFTQATSTFTVWLTEDHSEVRIFVRAIPTNNIQAMLSFDAPEGLSLAPGVYRGATRWPFHSPVAPGLDAAMESRGCNTSSGHFTVYEALYTVTHQVERFRASFQQHCHDVWPALRGEIFIGTTPAPSLIVPPRSAIGGPARSGGRD